MANKKIPVKDKEVVLQRLAEGQSTRQAIQGTSIASNQTAAALAKSESHTIAQYRKDYYEMISYYCPEPLFKHRACQLADMLSATKLVHHGGGHYAPVPDWPVIMKAIQYIDMLAGLTQSSGTQINVVQQVTGNNNGNVVR